MIFVFGDIICFIVVDLEIGCSHDTMITNHFNSFSKINVPMVFSGLKWSGEVAGEAKRT